MSTKTKNYELIVPAGTDVADITALNENWNKIDEELSKRADLDDTGKVPPEQLPPMDYIPTTEKGQPGGVPVLDENGKLDPEVLGDAGFEVTGAASTIIKDNLTANRALISNGSGKVAVSPVTSTELGYLDGVTSGIQTQLNNKLSTRGGTMSGMITFQNTDAYHILHKYRVVNGTTYGVNIGCGVLGGEGMVVLEVHEGDATDSPIIGRLEVSRLGVSYHNNNGTRTYIHRTSAVPASVEN
jgi:hypothetical protein